MEAVVNKDLDKPEEVEEEEDDDAASCSSFEMDNLAAIDRNMNMFQIKILCLI